MNWMLNLVVALQILAALVMIGLVLIQHGKGADMGASFGSGASGSLFGATGSANFLSRSTAVCAAVFFVCTLALAFFTNDRSRPSTGSVLDRPTISAPAASAPATGAALIPGPASGAAAVPAPALPAPAAPAVAPATTAPANAASGAAAIPK
jgi:preprotein translocase subunit SecG